MDREAIAEAWAEAKKPRDKAQLLREKEVMGGELQAEKQLNHALFKTLEGKGQSLKKGTNKAFGFDSWVTTRGFTINLGSIMHEGMEICMQAELGETYDSGQDSVGGSYRDISFKAGLIGGNLSKVPDGYFRAYLAPVDDRLLESRLEDMIVLNQQMRDIAEIIGVEVPTVESLTQAA